MLARISPSTAAAARVLPGSRISTSTSAASRLRLCNPSVLRAQSTLATASPNNSTNTPTSNPASRSISTSPESKAHAVPPAPLAPLASLAEQASQVSEEVSPSAAVKQEAKGVKKENGAGAGLSIAELTGLPPIEETMVPLAKIPTAALYRSLLLHGVTSSPPVMALGLKVLHSQMNAMDKGGLLKWAVDKTFYAQFCSGSSGAEIRHTVDSLRSLGFAGIILAYAREVELSDAAPDASTLSTQLAAWLDGTLKTIAHTDPGDFVAVKYSGAGRGCLRLLAENKSYTADAEMHVAVMDICTTAKKRGVRLLIDAEQQSVQEGIHNWTVDLMRKFNKDKVVVGNTYQMYLKASPGILASHLEIAKREGFHLGVKLVRGAYLHSDPRQKIHDTKEDTDAAYDAAVRFLLSGEAMHSAFPARVSLPTKKTDLLIASHNKASVRTARELRRKWGRENSGVGEMVYGQLLGMADELSMALIEEAEEARRAKVPGVEPVKVYKYAVWGTTQECVKYLVRRAEENKDAVGRSRENVSACWEELRRRAWGLKSAQA